MCGNGTFGQDCTEQCGECLRKEQCHHVDGSCANGCNPGYQGLMCTKGCHFIFYYSECLIGILTYQIEQSVNYLNTMNCYKRCIYMLFDSQLENDLLLLGVTVAGERLHSSVPSAFERVVVITLWNLLWHGPCHGLKHPNGVAYIYFECSEIYRISMFETSHVN